MAWRTIAKKDVREVTDSRTVTWGLAFLVFVFFVGGYVLPLNVDDPTTADLPTYMADAVGLLVPLFGLLLGYNAIVEERASGQMTLLLALPHSRLDVVVGKLVGRGAALVAALGGGILLAAALVVYPFGSLDPLALAGYLLATLLFGVAFLGIGIAISTLTASKQTATAGAFGVFFLFVVLWPQLPDILALVLEELGLADGGLPDWALFLHGLEPGMCYERVLEGFWADDPSGAAVGPDAPWYLGEWVALGLLGAWSSGPIAAGYLRFAGTDL